MTHTTSSRTDEPGHRRIEQLCQPGIRKEDYFYGFPERRTLHFRWSRHQRFRYG